MRTVNIPAEDAQVHLRKATINYEEADGGMETATSVLLEYSDGSSATLVGGQLEVKPQGSPKTWREIAHRARDDGETLPITSFQAKQRARRFAEKQAFDEAQAEKQAAEDAAVAAALVVERVDG